MHYRPPSSSPLILDSLCTYIESFNVHQYSNYILLGDSPCNSSLFCKPKSFSTLFSVEQIVTESSHIHHNGSVSLIDLIFVSQAKNILTHSCNVTPPLVSSDHKGIHLQCNWRLTPRHNCANRSKGNVVWCYYQVDWERAMLSFDSFDWTSLQSNDVNESWSNWCEQFLSIMCECQSAVQKPSLAIKRAN